MIASAQHAGTWVVYDYDEATRPVTRRELNDLPEVALAVRLLLGEMGPHRLLESRHAMREAVGIVQTVEHRLDPAFYNPKGVARLEPWPGCGPRGNFSECANDRQYLGLGNPAALRPTSHHPPEVLGPAVDRAVAAWWLARHVGVPDVTGGATSFVHRCGGAAYGRRTVYCDGAPNPGDIRGALPHHGPAVFKGPTNIIPRRGYYALQVTAKVDYEHAAPDGSPHAAPSADHLAQFCAAARADSVDAELDYGIGATR